MIWLPVVGYELEYDVSDTGMVRSKGRYLLDRRYWKGGLLKESLCSDGSYYKVTLSKDGVPRTHMVHQLVAQSFIGPCPEGMEVCHNDGNSLNNYRSNVRYDTRENNHADKVAHGTDNRGSRNHNSILTEYDIPRIRYCREHGETYRSLADRYDVGTMTIVNICKRNSWKHIE